MINWEKKGIKFIFQYLIHRSAQMETEDMIITYQI